MFWLTVRQHRMQLLVTTAALVAIGVVLLVHGLVTKGAMAGLSGLELDQLLLDRVEVLHQMITWLPAAPVLIGLFWGAPLVARETEHGTHTLAWTQSVTRRRWIAVKLGWLATIVTLSGLALGAMINAWLGTFAGTEYAGRFGNTGIFAASGVAVAGWWLFAFMLGVACGALSRRLLPAMAVELAVFFVALFGVFTLREGYATPERMVHDLGVLDIPDGDAWIVGATWVAADGTELPAWSQIPAGCPDDPGAPSVLLECLRQNGYQAATYVQPSERYWRFQWTEAGILAAGAALLAGVTYQRVTRSSI